MPTDTATRACPRSGSMTSAIWPAALFGIIQAVVFLTLARHVPLTGDEVFYYENSRLIAPLVEQALRLDGANADATLSKLVSHGWFAPGMSFFLAPITAVTDSVAVARGLAGLANFGLVWLLLHRLRDMFGHRAAWVYVAVAMLVPNYLMFTFMVWGELFASHLFVLLLLAVSAGHAR